MQTLSRDWDYLFSMKRSKGKPIYDFIHVWLFALTAAYGTVAQEGYP